MSGGVDLGGLIQKEQGAPPAKRSPAPKREPAKSSSSKAKKSQTLKPVGTYEDLYPKMVRMPKASSKALDAMASDLQDAKIDTRTSRITANTVCRVAIDLFLEVMDGQLEGQTEDELKANALELAKQWQ